MKHGPHKDPINFGFMSLSYIIRDLKKPPATILENAGVKQGDNVLDFGCGPGSFSIAAAAIAGNNGFIYAADVTDYALKSVQKRAKKKNIDNIKTINTSCATGIEDSSIDIILFYNVLHEVENVSMLIKEFYRVLKDGGKVSAADKHLEKKEITGAFTGRGLFRLDGENNGLMNFIKV